jgi:predicted ATPase
VSLVHARTGGNPLFVTEIARLPSVEALAIPENVRAAISQRLNRLSPLANHILFVASVLGREFEFRVVAAVLSDAVEESLLHALDEALQAALIEPLPRRGDHSYHFKHQLIRDALYDSILPGRRAQWDAAILRTLERLHGPLINNYAAELATHAARAEVLVGSATLVKYSRIAGEQKLAAYAFEDALPHFELAWRARNGLPLDAEAAAILFGLGCAQATTALRWNRQEGWVNLRRAMSYNLETGEVGRAVAAATHPSIVPEGVADVSEAIEPLLAAVPRGSIEEGWLRARLGAAVYFETGNYQRARTAFDRALEIAAAQREQSLELRALTYETSVDHFDLRWHDVLSKSRRVLKRARRIDDLHSETYARYRSAFVLTNIGRAGEAKGEVEANLAAAERLRDHGLLADALYVATLLAQLTGA